MSRHALEVLLDADCSPAEKLVLLVIARHGGGTNGSGGWPSVRRIARIAGTSPSTTWAALTSMRDKKWLSWDSGNAQENKPNKYAIHLDKVPMLPDLWRSPVQPCIAHRYSPVSDPVSPADTDPYRFEAEPVPVAGTEASTELKTNTPPSPKARGRKQCATQCEAIYNAYPKHKDRQKALPAIAKALKTVPYPELLAKVERYAQKVQKDVQENGADGMQFVKYPATWFNAGAYDDDDLKPPVEYDVVEVSPEEWDKGGSRGIQ